MALPLKIVQHQLRTYVLRRCKYDRYIFVAAHNNRNTIDCVDIHWYDICAEKKCQWSYYFANKYPLDVLWMHSRHVNCNLWILHKGDKKKKLHSTTAQDCSYQYFAAQIITLDNKCLMRLTYSLEDEENIHHMYLCQLYIQLDKHSQAI